MLYEVITGHVVGYADRKMPLGLRLAEFFESGLGHCRRVFLGRQAVPAPDDFGCRKVVRPIRNS